MQQNKTSPSQITNPVVKNPSENDMDDLPGYFKRMIIAIFVQFSGGYLHTLRDQKQTGKLNKKSIHNMEI